MVQIFKETEVQLSTFKLKMPLCMGSLISHHHILTTKYCFGSDKYEEIHGSDYAYEEIMKWDQKGRVMKSNNSICNFDTKQINRLTTLIVNLYTVNKNICFISMTRPDICSISKSVDWKDCWEKILS